MNNNNLFDAGMKKAGEIVSVFIYDYLVKVCEALVDDAVKKKRGWSNFTGNTITSYAHITIAVGTTCLNQSGQN